MVLLLLTHLLAVAVGAWMLRETRPLASPRAATHAVMLAELLTTALVI
jgi:hypothetical protein